jgi:hypothetical protein
MVVAARCIEPGRLPWPGLIGLGVALLGFLVWWPVGAAIVVFLIWRIARMGCGHHRRLRDWHEHAEEFCGFGWWRHGRRAERSTGNRAFDAYRAEMLRRLEEDQRDFAEYLDHLRHAKDQAEFDQFLAERARRRSEGDRPQQPQA